MTVTGTIVDDGTPLATQFPPERQKHVVVVLLVDESGATQGTTTTDSAGTFEIANIQPGKYKLAVWKSAAGKGLDAPDEYNDAYSATNSKIIVEIPDQPTYNIGTIDLAQYR